MKISLLLTTYNCKSQLRGTLACIRRQTFHDFEVVIADGGSTDGTLDLIQRFEEAGDIPVRWVSEPDKGLYDALNKTVRMARGNYLLVCNDRLAKKESLEKLLCAVESGDYVGAHADLVYAEMGDANKSKTRRYWHMGNSHRLWTGWMPGHPTLLLKKEIYDRYGLYRPDYRIAADYEFMVRFLKDKDNHLAYVPEILIRMYYGGTSTAHLSDYIDSFKEGYRALHTNGISAPESLFITSLRTLRVLTQFRKT